MKICQSCSMPMTKPEDFGTNADGSVNEDYCHYCMKDGSFTKVETMDEMIETCIPFVSKGDPYPDEETARKALKEFFPTLKRWS